MNTSEKVVDIILLSNCNFSCDYCISGSNKWDYPITLDDNGDIKYIEDLRLVNGIKNLQAARDNGLSMADSIYLDQVKHTGNFKHQFLDLSALTNYIRDNLDGWTLAISGGEPLLYPKLDIFLKEITNTNRVILLTNLSLIKSNMSILDIADDRLFYRIGYHPENRSIEHFLSCIDIIKQHNKKYVVNYVLHPSYVDNNLYKAHIDVLIDNNINYEITRFEGIYNDERYNAKDPIRDWERSILDNDYFNLKYDIEGIAGKSYLAILADGDVWECHNYQHRLGNVYKNTLDLSPVVYENCISCETKCPSILSHGRIFDQF
jgi:organic radical activating enzyme